MKLLHKQVIPPALMLGLFCVAIALLYQENRHVLRDLSVVANHSQQAIQEVYLQSITAFMQVIEAASLDPLINQEPDTLNSLLAQLRRSPAVQSTFYIDTDETILADGVDPEDIERLGEELVQSEILPERFLQARHLLEVRDDQL